MNLQIDLIDIGFKAQSPLAIHKESMKPPYDGSQKLAGSNLVNFPKRGEPLASLRLELQRLY